METAQNNEILLTISQLQEKLCDRRIDLGDVKAKTGISYPTLRKIYNGEATDDMPHRIIKALSRYFQG